MMSQMEQRNDRGITCDLLALQEGRLVIIDELDAKLHPKLLRYVISLFKNKNVNKRERSYSLLPMI